MHEILRIGLDRLGVSAPALEEASRLSIRHKTEAAAAARAFLTQKYGYKVFDGLPIDIVVFGSIARQESSDASDFDYGLVVYGLVGDPQMLQDIRLAAEEARVAVMLGKPGASRIFGSLISASEFVDRIGLEQDTNRNHTNRMLLLEESCPLLLPERHSALVAAVLDRYVADYEGDGNTSMRRKKGVPRFLLNDVVRYWRTLAVDYQAKRWDEIEGKKWGLRYLKLRSTRKLGFVSTVISLFMPRITDQFVTSAYLQSQFNLPSLARIAQLSEHVENDEIRAILAKILTSAEYFASVYADKDFRDEVNDVQHPIDAPAAGRFQEAREQTNELQAHLTALFNSPKPINSRSDLSFRSLTSDYLLF